MVASLLAVTLALVAAPGAEAAKAVSLRSWQPEEPKGTAVSGTWRETEYYEVEESKVPPEPEGEAPPKEDDGAYGTKVDACKACKFTATGSCAMFKTCVCYATNSHFDLIGLPDNADKSNFKWACGNEGGSKYELCFNVNELYEDPFGDKIDPNNPKCP
jgi:hypothetical protein